MSKTSAEELVEALEKMPMKAKCYLLKKIGKLDFGDIADMYISLQYCKSPIEVILGTALFIRTEGLLYFEPQMEINYEGKRYYADLGIYGDENINTFLKDGFQLVIECDGYEFHQKTKRQVEQDNKREYDIKSAGYDILRFSGSEIYNDVDTCVEKILNYIKLKGTKDEQH